MEQVELRAGGEDEGEESRTMPVSSRRPNKRAEAAEENKFWGEEHESLLDILSLRCLEDIHIESIFELKVAKIWARNLGSGTFRTYVIPETIINPISGRALTDLGQESGLHSFPADFPSNCIFSFLGSLL